MSQWVTELYDDDFREALAEHGLLFVDFYADWCGPCQAVAPVVDRVARAYAGRVAFGKLNIDGNRRTAARYGVRSIPTLILFREGQPAARLGGFQPENRLRLMLDRYAPPSMANPEGPPPPRAPGVLARLFHRG